MTAPPPGAGKSTPSPGTAAAAAGTQAPDARGARNATRAVLRPSLRPFLKWAGGKGQLRRELLSRVPAEIGCYFEPMVGGGALFFALAGSEDRLIGRVVLNDANEELMAAYGVVRNRVEPLIERLGAHACDYLQGDVEERDRYYYDVRASAPADELERAARMLFLNRTCYNGLYRVNRSGQFNVPHGRYARPRILDEEALRSASRALAEVELRSGDVADACADAEAGDFVYLDPPFFPLNPTSNFTDYTMARFGVAEQRQLRWLIDDLTERGVLVMLSNSDVDWVHAAYETARYAVGDSAGGRRGPAGAEYAHHRIDSVPARRMINSRGDRRSAIAELVVMNPPLAEALERGAAS